MADDPVVLHRDQVVAFAQRLLAEGYDYFVYCAAAHFPAEAAPEPPAEAASDAPPAEASPEPTASSPPEPPAQAAGKPDRVLVEYRVRRLPADMVAFRVEVPTGESTPTLSGIWPGADWQEREQFDLVGVIFEGHPDLRRIMLPEDWEGHPLRRDYAIETRHPPWR